MIELVQSNVQLNAHSLNFPKRDIQNARDLEVHGIAATVPAFSAAVRRMQVLLVSTSDGSDVGTGDEEPIRVDDLDEGPEAVSETESVGRDSDLASVVFSEASTVSVEEPGIRPVANARDFTRVGSVGCFPPHRDLRETCQRGAGRHPRHGRHVPRTRLEASSPLPTNPLMQTPQGRVHSQKRTCRGWHCSTEEIGRSLFHTVSVWRNSLPKFGVQIPPPQF